MSTQPEERDLAHEADMERLRREQLRADISPEEAAEELAERDHRAELEDRAAWREGADLDDGEELLGDPDEYDEHYCVCQAEHGPEELDSNQCDCCGRAIE
jgi:hypothetical protein